MIPSITWVNRPMFMWLLALAILTLIVGWSLWSRNTALRNAISPRLLPIMLPGAHLRRWPAAICGLLSVALLILAAADPRWGRTTREVPQRGIEVVFLLDVSRSMLAEDVAPNRLERAKQQIKDMIDEMAGDRIGLVAFAGESRQVVPMTSHYEDFKQQLDELGPATLRRGGSKLGVAITVAADAFLEKSADHKAIVILTDGEDQESDPVGRATTVHRNNGVRIFAIGLGDELRGSTIPDTNPDNPRQRTGDVVQYDGQTVVSKMNGDVLQAVAEASQGAYIPAGTKRVNMSEVYHGFVANVPQREFETATVDALTLRFEWFAVPALILLLLEMILARPRVAMLLLFCLVSGASVNADESKYRAGLTAAEAEQYEEAIHLFMQSAASPVNELAADSRANMANLRMRLAAQLAEHDRQGAIGQLQNAITHYRDALRVQPDNDPWRANIELAARWIKQLNEQQQQQDQQNQQEQKEKEEKDEEEKEKEEKGKEEKGGQENEEDKKPSDPQQKDPSESTEPSDQPQDPTPKQEPDPKQDPASPSSDAADSPQTPPDNQEPDDPPEPTGPLKSTAPSEPKPGQMEAGSVSEAKELSREEAEKLLQSVRDREMLRRFIQQQRDLKRQVPVDKDW